MIDIGALKASMTVDTAQAEKDVTQFTEKASSSGGKFGAAMKKVGVGVAAATAAAAAAVTAVGKSVVDLSSAGDEIDKTSQKLGVSAEYLQEWRQIADYSGVSAETISTQFKKMETNLADGNKAAIAAVETLGYSVEEMAGMSTEEQFNSIIYGLQGIEDEAQRSALAVDIFGRQGYELGPILNTSAEEMEALKQTIAESGAIMSDEAVKASAHLNDTITTLKNTLSGLKNQLLGDLLPVVDNVVAGFTKLVGGNTEEGVKDLTSGIEGFIKSITSKFPKIVPIVKSVLLSLFALLPTLLPELLDGILQLVTDVLNMLPEVLPDVLTNVLQTIFNLISTLLADAPAIISAVLSVIMSIINWVVSDGIPMLVTMIPQIISELVAAIMAMLPDICLAIVQIVVAITQLSIQLLPMLIQMVVDIIMQVVAAIQENGPAFLEAFEEVGPLMAQAFANAGPLILEALKQLWELIKLGWTTYWNTWLGGMKNLWSGLKGAVSGVWTKFSDWISGKWNEFLDNLAVIKEAIKLKAQGMINGLLDGFKEKWQAVKDWVDEKVQWIKDAWSTATSLVSGGSHRSGLSYVPSDGYVAELHRGEMVLTETEADAYRSGMVAQAQPSVIQNIQITVPDTTNTMQAAVNIKKTLQAEKYNFAPV